jgi:hypothetical protein
MTVGINLPIPQVVVDRILQRVRITASGCWVVERSLNENGYARIGWTDGDGRHQAYTHRAMWLATSGPIADGRELDHLCRTRSCCNPAHLEVVTPAENARRGRGGEVGGARQRAKTHCPYGHEYTLENTYIFPKSGGRACRVCRLEESRRTQGWKGGVPLGERTHCPQGHEYTIENTAYTKRGSRACRACARERSRDRRARTKSLVCASQQATR